MPDTCGMLGCQQPSVRVIDTGPDGFVAVCELHEQEAENDDPFGLKAAFDKQGGMAV